MSYIPCQLSHYSNRVRTFVIQELMLCISFALVIYVYAVSFIVGAILLSSDPDKSYHIDNYAKVVR